MLVFKKYISDYVCHGLLVTVLLVSFWIICSSIDVFWCHSLCIALMSGIHLLKKKASIYWMYFRRLSICIHIFHKRRYCLFYNLASVGLWFEGLGLQISWQNALLCPCTRKKLSTIFPCLVSCYFLYNFIEDVIQLLTMQYICLWIFFFWEFYHVDNEHFSSFMLKELNYPFSWVFVWVVLVISFNILRIILLELLEWLSCIPSSLQHFLTDS